MHPITGAEIQRPGDLTAILSDLQAREVLLIDEAEGLAAPVADLLSEAMANFDIEILIGKGSSARRVLLPLQDSRS
jgi:Holliday junction DNA helicase RuvB